MTSASASASAAADKAQDSTAFRVAARIGYVVLGLLHLLIGAIAVSIATGGAARARIRAERSSRWPPLPRACCCCG